MSSAATAVVVDGETVDRSTGEVLGLVKSERKMTMLRPLAQPAEIMQVQNETRDFVHQALKDGRDYGVIPGTGDKKVMLKPGAERTALAFGCGYGEPTIIEKEIDHDREVRWRKSKAKWEGRGADRKRVGEEVTEGVSLGLYRYVVSVPVIERASGNTVAVGVGTCSTMESKYIDRPRDSENTVLKMAHKRALVAACLLAFGLSDEFTQDVEENPELYTKGDGDGAAASGEQLPNCPKCGGKMWDNRPKKAAGEMNAKAPDFKCRDRSCDTALWPGQWPPKEKAAGSGAPAKLTVDQAKAFLYRGKVLSELTSEKLQEIAAWIIEKDTRKTQHAELLQAIGLVLGDRDQQSLALDEKPAAAAPANAPKPGAVGDALTPNATTPAALEDEDDDLPF